MQWSGYRTIILVIMEVFVVVASWSTASFSCLGYDVPSQRRVDVGVSRFILSMWWFVCEVYGDRESLGRCFQVRFEGTWRC